MNQKLQQLVNLSQKSHSAFLEAQNDIELRPYLIKDSLPILYFGDIEAYFKSKYKVITAAINPSSAEFFYDDSAKMISFARFPQLARIDKEQVLSDKSALQYLSALNGYFQTGNDYRQWFNRTPRNNLFAPFGASYYDNAPNRAIHTDTLSPFATFPKWSDISPRIQRRFSEVGIALWHELIAILEPDIIFMSLNKKYISHTDFYRTFRDYVVYADKKYNGKSLKIQYGYIQLNTKTAHIFNESRTNQMPFNALGSKDSVILGAKIFERFTNGLYLR
ncbi:hypothetical protein [Helicobacter sp. 23-1045]